MITKYLHAAMLKAKYEILPEGTNSGEIPGFQGVWANADTLEACRNDLQEVLESCLMLAFGAISRKDLIRYLRDFGFDGPYSGSTPVHGERPDSILTCQSTPGRNQPRSAGAYFPTGWDQSRGLGENKMQTRAFLR
jgi:hypothetical protein